MSLAQAIHADLERRYYRWFWLGGKDPFYRIILHERFGSFVALSVDEISATASVVRKSADKRTQEAHTYATFELNDPDDSDRLWAMVDYVVNLTPEPVEIKNLIDHHRKQIAKFAAGFP